MLHRLARLLLLLFIAALPAGARVRNVILFIGDGTGFAHLQAARLYGGEPLVVDRFPVRLAMSTFSASNADGYDPAQSDSLDYLRRGATDSAASSTALACGILTLNGKIGVDPGDQSVANLVELAGSTGRATGVVTSVQWSHATPAGMVAHVDSRSSYAEIARQMLASELDLILGCGHPEYDSAGAPSGEPDHRYVGGEETWRALRTGALADWRLIERRAEFAALADGRLRVTGRVCGTAQVRDTLQAGRPGAEAGDAPDDDPHLTHVPDLATMTRGALAHLARERRGLFLMVEGGAIDWAAHGNHLGRTIEEVNDFTAAIAAACDWVTANRLWHETLVVVTADHETGALFGPPEGSLNDLVDRGAGELPGAVFNSTGHTNSLVPLFAAGAGSVSVEGAVSGQDPRHGGCLHSTQLHAVLRMLLSEPAEQAAPLRWRRFR